MSIRCITFDLDDTLWDCAPVIDRAEQAAYDWLAAHYPRITGRHAPGELIEHRKAFFAGYPQLHHDFTRLRKLWLRALAAEGGYDESLVEPGFHAFWHARNDVEIYADARDALEALTGVYRLGTISNGNADVNYIGIGHYFDFVVSAAVAGAAKPDPLIFQAALDEAGVAAREALHVGDDPVRDVAGAAAVGMRTVWINPARAPWPGGVRADAELASVGDLPALVEAWNAAATP